MDKGFGCRHVQGRQSRALNRGYQRQNTSVAEEILGEHWGLDLGEQVLKYFDVLTIGAAIWVWTDGMLADDMPVGFATALCHPASVSWHWRGPHVDTGPLGNNKL